MGHDDLLKMRNDYFNRCEIHKMTKREMANVLMTMNKIRIGKYKLMSIKEGRRVLSRSYNFVQNQKEAV